MNECDKCGLCDPDCQCYVHELEIRITHLEEELDKLTDTINLISEYIKRNKCQENVKNVQST